MKLEMTKNQFKTLLELVFLGNWVANSHRVEGEIEKYDAMEKEIFSMASRFGLPEFADEDGYPSRIFEESIQELIDEYDEETFWSKLVERMAWRDFYRQYSEEQLERMNQNQRFEKLCSIIANYEELFRKYGLDALTIVALIKP